jgi:hypothetical protein
VNQRCFVIGERLIGRRMSPIEECLAPHGRIAKGLGGQTDCQGQAQPDGHSAHLSIFEAAFTPQ